MSKPRVFRDEKLQEEFDKNGFVKFRMFSEEQVRRLHQFYLNTRKQHETVIDRRMFHATNDTDNPDLIGTADSFIKQVMSEEVDKHFYNYKTIAANYLLKQPSTESYLAPHQDLRFVDESKYYSFNIWVATEPTNKINGCLRFLEGSHLLHDTIRPLPSYPWKYQNVTQLMPAYFTDVTTEIGDCIILNHASIHASYPNMSGHIRIAAILAMIPSGAEIFHYFLPDGDPGNEVEKYAMSLNDFVNLKVGQRPDSAILIDKFKYDFLPVEESFFIQWLEEKFPKPQIPINNYGYGFIKNKLSTLFRNFR